jgi:hypothetical protein
MNLLTSLDMALLIVFAHVVAALAGAIFGAAGCYLVWALKPFPESQRRV